MDYDYRNRVVPPPSPYDSQIPMYRQSSTPSTTTSSSNHPMYGQPMYPRIGQPGHAPVPAPAPARTSSSSHHQTSAPSSSGLGIRVAIKPEYRITPPPQLSPQVGEIPRSTFHFDFEFEKKILAEAEKDSQNWSRIDLPSKPTESTSSMAPITDPVVRKYIAFGLSREAVPLAIANYGDNPTKVQEFVNGYNLLREMGFSSNTVAEALAMYDNDTDKALAYLLKSSS